MKLKVLTWSLSILGIAVVALSALWVIDIPVARPVLNVIAQGLPILGPLRPDLPIRLTIPKINVDATIEHVGLTPQGTMGVPSGPSGVAWFDLGPRPGEKGSAVIDGHEGWKDGISAVFDDLDKLRKGDEIMVQDERGAMTTFIVREVRTYNQNSDAASIFYSSDGKAHLNLITCEGVWDATTKSYVGRLVVFADKQE